MNRDIQIIRMLSDDPADCSPIWSPGDELAHTVFVTVITVGVAEKVTIVLTVMSCVLVMTDVVPTVLVGAAVTKEVK